MAGFRKAKAEQAALKIGIYGPAGSGKSLTSLLIAEAIADTVGKRVAYVDTERGTDFYCQAVAERSVHPAAFDFDALYTKSLMETLKEVKALDPKTHGVVVIDSITHLWEAARLAYEGRTTRAGTIPMGAWANIKKPYKELMSFLLSSTMHVVICGRQANEFKEDEETGEMKLAGVKMRAEGETQYEPHILLRMEPIKNKRETIITAFAEKDRAGVYSGKTLQLWPAKVERPVYEYIVKPILPLLGETQGHIQTDDEISVQDAEAQNELEKERNNNSIRMLTEFSAKFDLCKTKDELKEVGKGITADIKRQMVPAHVNELKNRYRNAESRVSGAQTYEPAEAA
jgi:hypothetical protein